MASFKDAKDRTWVIDIDPLNVGEVHSEMGVSLYTLLNDGMKELRELLDNQPVFLNVVYILVRDQCKAQGIDDREFLRGLKGDAMDAMSEAFYYALADFFPKKKRELMKELMVEAKTLADPLLAKASTKAMMLLRKQFGTWSESLDSIQEASHSADLSGPPKDSSSIPGSSNPV